MGLRHNFADEVVFSLLQTFAHCVTGETNDFDVTVLFEILRNCQIAVLNENLFVEANVFVEFVNSAHEHLFDDCFGLFAVLVESLCFENFFLMVNFGLRNFFSANVLCVCR